MFEPVLLKTDVLFFVLLSAAACYAWTAARHEHLRAPWRQVARQPLGMAAAVVLAVYVLIAFLDSLHFRAAPGAAGESKAAYSRDLNSVFDVLVAPLRDSVERMITSRGSAGRAAGSCGSRRSGGHRPGGAGPRPRVCGPRSR